MNRAFKVLSAGLFFFGLLTAAEAQIESIRLATRNMAITNRDTTNNYPDLTNFYSATDYRTYSFGDPNYDGLATPVFFAEMLQAITDEATERNDPLVRHALSILLSKTYAFITALDSELYRADRRYMDEFEWTLLRSTYNRQLRAIAKLLVNNAAALDPDYFREHADALASAEQRIASNKTNFSDEEWAALTDKNNWWETTRRRMGRDGQQATSKLSLLVTVANADAAPAAAQRAVLPGLYDSVRLAEQQPETAGMVVIALLRLERNRNYFAGRLNAISLSTSDSALSNLYQDFARRTLRQSAPVAINADLSGIGACTRLVEYGVYAFED